MMRGLAAAVVFALLAGAAEAGPGTLATAVAVEASRTQLARHADAQQTQTQTPSPRRNWVARHPRLFGALVGFGAGCAITAARVGGSEDTFANALDEAACPVGGAIGAGIGTAVGWAFTR